MKMKKIVAVLLSIIMVLILTMTALADNELRLFYSDKKLVQETEEKLLKYLADENPDLAAMVIAGGLEFGQ